MCFLKTSYQKHRPQAILHIVFITIGSDKIFLVEHQIGTGSPKYQRASFDLQMNQVGNCCVQEPESDVKILCHTN